MSDQNFRLNLLLPNIKSPLVLWLISLVVVVLLSYLALWSSPYSFASTQIVIRVYCASAAVEPMQQIVDRFNESSIASTERYTAQIVRSGGSGELAGQISAEQLSGFDSGCSLFVSADPARIQSMLDDGLVVSPITLAYQNPVFVVSYRASVDAKKLSNLQSILDLAEFRLAIGSESTAIGAITRQYALQKGQLQQLESHKVTDAENVMTLALAVTAGGVDGAVVWDSTVALINSNQTDQLRMTGYLDPTKQLSGEVILVKTKPTDLASNTFESFIRDDIVAVGDIFSQAGFSVSRADSFDSNFACSVD